MSRAKTWEESSEERILGENCMMLLLASEHIEEMYHKPGLHAFSTGKGV